MWIAPPSIRLSFALELGCSEKDLQPDFDTWVSIAAVSSTLNGRHTRAQSWKLACRKGLWLQRLYGAAISENSLPLSFVVQWIASLRASRAKTCHSQAVGLGLMGRDLACSSTSSTLPMIAKRQDSFWRTSQASLLPPPPLWTKPKGLLKNAQLPASWENWPTEGGMRNGSLCQRPKWVPATGGRGGSALLGEIWTTPDVCSGARDMSKIDPELQKRADTKRATGLPTEAAMWPTPAARDHKGANSEQHATVTGGGQETHGSVSQLCGLFAPGPADPRWVGIIAAEPWLSPALSIEGEHDAKAAFQEAQSLLRGTPDGLAIGLVFSHRAQRLKCVGNGVVPLQAAVAFITLARRAGFMKKQPVAIVNKAQSAINIEVMEIAA